MDVQQKPKVIIVGEANLGTGIVAAAATEMGAEVVIVGKPGEILSPRGISEIDVDEWPMASNRGKEIVLEDLAYMARIESPIVLVELPELNPGRISGFLSSRRHIRKKKKRR